MATKKLKKVETPIDQRETFVSLQKTFAESEMSVKEKLMTLYQLQEADTQIDKILQLRGDLPSEVENIESEIASYKAKIEAAETLVASYKDNIAANEQNIVDLDADIERYRKLLDNIENSREFDSISKELENQDLLRQIAEKNINETRNAILAKKAQIEDYKAQVELRTDDLAAKKEELSTIVESTSSDESVLRGKREALAAKVDARTMSAYDRIRASVHNHLAVVGVYNGDSCGGCFNQITSQRLVDIASNNKLVICENCGRIIVNTNFDDEQ